MDGEDRGGANNLPRHSIGRVNENIVAVGKRRFDRQCADDGPVSAECEIGFRISVTVGSWRRMNEVGAAGIARIGVLRWVAADDDVYAGSVFAEIAVPMARLELQHAIGLGFISKPGIAVSASGNGVMPSLAAVAGKEVIVICAAEIDGGRTTDAADPGDVYGTERLESVRALPVHATI